MNHRNHDTSPGHNGPAKPAARRDYKDSVFRMLFRDRTNLLSLYNAVNQTSYTDPEELAVITLENAVYMNMKNDVAFLMDFRLNLYEHQSTWNPNMPSGISFMWQRNIRSLRKARPFTLPASSGSPLPALSCSTTAPG